MEIIKKLQSFDFERIKTDTLSILERYSWPQIGLTHSIKEMTAEEKLLESVGSIKDPDTGKFKFAETDFVVFNEEFKGTALYEMYQSLENIGRFRIMTMMGPVCYTIHNDLTRRYHYVIETNPDCIFLFPGLRQQFHIPCDQHLYLVDTRFRHTFVNGSRQRRIHLVLDDLSTLK